MSTKTLPRIDGLYWALVISATTLGETAGDLISQTLGLGYGGGTIALVAMFVVAMAAECALSRRVGWLYWTVLTLASIGGTTLADWCARTLGLGYPVSACLIGATLVVTLSAWKLWTRSRDLRASFDTAGEVFYWLAILSSSTFGTSIGDLLSKDELDLDGLSMTDTAFGPGFRHMACRRQGLGLATAARRACCLRCWRRWSRWRSSRVSRASAATGPASSSRIRWARRSATS
jgi:uncharacterized membrane-anchored protein